MGTRQLRRTLHAATNPAPRAPDSGGTSSEFPSSRSRGQSTCNMHMYGVFKSHLG
jgi:hypothetical protein